MKKRLLSALLVALMGLSAHAYDTFPVPDSENPKFEINVFRPGESIYLGDEPLWTSTFDIDDSYTSSIYTAANTWGQYFSDIGNTPVGYALLSFDEYNAGATSPYMNVDELNYKVTWINAMLHDYHVTDGTGGLSAPVEGFILLGLGVSETNPGWHKFDGKHPLYRSSLPDLNATISHELMHSFGITSYAQADKTDGITYMSKSDTDTLSLYDKDLRVYTGSEGTFDPNLELAPQPHMSVGEGKEFDVITNSPYYVGNNTIKVLGSNDNYDSAKQAIVDNGGLKNYSLKYSAGNNEDKPFPVVYGMPIHPADSSGADIDLSHLELRNSFMSHQNYRNWTVPMEAELAVMKDLGYDIDLRKYFGKSYYLNNVTETYTRGFSNWDGTQYTGAPSTIDQAIGIHIYGNRNSITQDAIISSVGEGAIGARIEGVQNDFVLAPGAKINMDGKENLGLAVTWGKNHNIALNSGSEVTAKGDGGIGVSFDFGGNMFGDDANHIGSYIYYYDYLKDDIQPHLEADDSLVDLFVVNGKVEGKDAAIYISDNAHVNEILINENAEIDGDIKSDWNSVTSGAHAHVLSENGGTWHKINPENLEDIHFTDLVIDEDLNPDSEPVINGNIDGDNGVFNTLKMKNKGTATLGGEKVAVYSLDNKGTLNIANKITFHTQDHNITGGGTLNVNEGKELVLGSDITNVDNTINLNNNSTLSTINEQKSNTTITKVNSTNGKISFDLGDTFTISEDSDEGKSGINLSQIAYDEETIADIHEGDSIQLFNDDSKKFDMQGSQVNTYYDGHKYTFTANEDNMHLDVTIDADPPAPEPYELKDAAEDPTTANYIVTEDELTKDAGTVKGEFFTVSGNDVNIASHGGLVIDGNENRGAEDVGSTTIKTGFYGAGDSDLIVQNKGHLIVDSSDKEITLGQADETAILINDGTVELNSNNNFINVLGDIKGTDKATDNINVTGSRVDLNTVNHVTVATNANVLNLNGENSDSNWEVNDGTVNLNAATTESTWNLNHGVLNMNAASNDSSWQINGGATLNMNAEGVNSSWQINQFAMMNVNNDSFLASNGTNSLAMNGGTLNVMNNQVTDIQLANMELQADSGLAMDIDVSNQAADKFVFNNSDDMVTNGNNIIITNVNVMNKDLNLDQDEYVIPFVDEKYNNQNLANNVAVDTDKFLFSSKYKYSLSYKSNGTTGNLIFTRIKNEFNPSLFASSVGAQVGAYLTQINSYDIAFGNMDMIMAMPKNIRKSLKYRNKYAFAGDGANLATYDPNQIPEESKGVWFKPYATFEKVGLKNGPKVENIAYGSYFGGDSDIIEMRGGWEGIFSGYAGYNGSHQNYDGISIYQNGGQIGATALFYKNDFFTGLTANVGASVANATTLFGHEDFTMLSTGVASKTGYNIGLADDKFIIQPSWLMSYTFVNTFDYTAANGIRIKSDPLNAIQLVPGLKFIGNLPHDWQPYAGVQMVWNLMDRTRFFADDVGLTRLSVRPYVQYGLGLQKRVGEVFTGYAQAMMRNGGRNGIALTFGFRWAL